MSATADPATRHSALPDHYSLAEPPASTGISRNGIGWNTSGEGEVGPMVLLFTHDPGRLVLDLSPAPGLKVTDEEYAAIQATVGLESLSLERWEPKEDGRRLIFSAPRQPRNRRGIQMVSVAFIRPADLLRVSPLFRLRTVGWQ